MPLLSFGAGLSDEFKKKLLNDKKRQTVREIRVHPIKVGDILRCWWKSRDPKRKQKLFDAVCTAVIPISINPFTSTVVLNGKPLTEEEVNEFAIADGFSSALHFFDYFARGRKTFQGVVIKFKKLDINWVPTTFDSCCDDKHVANYQGWHISTYSPNGGIVAVSVGKKGEYWQASTDHCEAWHDVKIHIKIAKDFISSKLT